MNIDRSLFNDIVDLITPHVNDPMSQSGLVNGALADAPRLRSQIQYGGAGRTFAVLLVRKCLDFGSLDGGKPALSAVLDYVYDLEGEENRARIREIQRELGDDVPAPTDTPIVERAELPPADNAPADKYVFISYASDDRAATVETYVKQLREHGYDVWVDREGIIGGESWKQSLANAINQAAVVNLIITPDSVMSKWVHAEVRRARELGKTVLPVMMRELKTDEQRRAFKEMDLGETHYISFVKDGSEKGMAQVLKALETHTVTS
jgi:hypothetical protein